MVLLVKGSKESVETGLFVLWGGWGEKKGERA